MIMKVEGERSNPPRHIQRGAMAIDFYRMLSIAKFEWKGWLLRARSGKDVLFRYTCIIVLDFRTVLTCTVADLDLVILQMHNFLSPCKQYMCP